jgi:hypothetical protein
LTEAEAGEFADDLVTAQGELGQVYDAWQS